MTSSNASKIEKTNDISQQQKIKNEILGMAEDMLKDDLTSCYPMYLTEYEQFIALPEEAYQFLVVRKNVRPPATFISKINGQEVAYKHRHYVFNLNDTKEKLKFCQPVQITSRPDHEHFTDQFQESTTEIVIGKFENQCPVEKKQSDWRPDFIFDETCKMLIPGQLISPVFCYQNTKELKVSKTAGVFKGVIQSKNPAYYFFYQNNDKIMLKKFKAEGTKKSNSGILDNISYDLKPYDSKQDLIEIPISFEEDIQEQDSLKMETKDKNPTTKGNQRPRISAENQQIKKSKKNFKVIVKSSEIQETEQNGEKITIVFKIINNQTQSSNPWKVKFEAEKSSDKDLDPNQEIKIEFYPEIGDINYLEKDAKNQESLEDQEITQQPGNAEDQEPRFLSQKTFKNPQEEINSGIIRVKINSTKYDYYLQQTRVEFKITNFEKLIKVYVPNIYVKKGDIDNFTFGIDTLNKENQLNDFASLLKPKIQNEENSNYQYNKTGQASCIIRQPNKLGFVYIFFGQKDAAPIVIDKTREFKISVQVDKVVMQKDKDTFVYFDSLQSSRKIYHFRIEDKAKKFTLLTPSCRKDFFVIQDENRVCYGIQFTVQNIKLGKKQAIIQQLTTAHDPTKDFISCRKCEQASLQCKMQKKKVLSTTKDQCSICNSSMRILNNDTDFYTCMNDKKDKKTVYCQNCAMEEYRLHDMQRGYDFIKEQGGYSVVQNQNQNSLTFFKKNNNELSIEKVIDEVSRIPVQIKQFVYAVRQDGQIYSVVVIDEKFKKRQLFESRNPIVMLNVITKICGKKQWERESLVDYVYIYDDERVLHLYEVSSDCQFKKLYQVSDQTSVSLDFTKSDVPVNQYWLGFGFNNDYLKDRGQCLMQHYKNQFLQNRIVIGLTDYQKERGNMKQFLVCKEDNWLVIAPQPRSRLVFNSQYPCDENKKYFISVLKNNSYWREYMLVIQKDRFILLTKKGRFKSFIDASEVRNMQLQCVTKCQKYLFMKTVNKNQSQSNQIEEENDQAEDQSQIEDEYFDRVRGIISQRSMKSGRDRGIYALYKIEEQKNVFKLVNKFQEERDDQLCFFSTKADDSPFIITVAWDKEQKKVGSCVFSSVIKENQLSVHLDYSKIYLFESQDTNFDEKLKNAKIVHRQDGDDHYVLMYFENTPFIIRLYSPDFKNQKTQKQEIFSLKKGVFNNKNLDVTHRIHTIYMSKSFKGGFEVVTQDFSSFSLDMTQEIMKRHSKNGNKFLLETELQKENRNYQTNLAGNTWIVGSFIMRQFTNFDVLNLKTNFQYLKDKKNLAWLSELDNMEWEENIKHLFTATFYNDVTALSLLIQGLENHQQINSQSQNQDLEDDFDEKPLSHEILEILLQKKLAKNTTDYFDTVIEHLITKPHLKKQTQEQIQEINQNSVTQIKSLRYKISDLNTLIDMGSVNIQDQMSTFLSECIQNQQMETFNHLIKFCFVGERFTVDQQFPELLTENFSEKNALKPYHFLYKQFNMMRHQAVNQSIGDPQCHEKTYLFSKEKGNNLVLYGDVTIFVKPLNLLDFQQIKKILHEQKNKKLKLTIMDLSWLEQDCKRKQNQLDSIQNDKKQQDRVKQISKRILELKKELEDFCKKVQKNNDEEGKIADDDLIDKDQLDSVYQSLRLKYQTNQENFLMLNNMYTNKNDKLEHKEIQQESVGTQSIEKDMETLMKKMDTLYEEKKAKTEEKDKILRQISSMNKEIEREKQIKQKTFENFWEFVTLEENFQCLSYEQINIISDMYWFDFFKWKIILFSFVPFVFYHFIHSVYMIYFNSLHMYGRTLSTVKLGLEIALGVFIVYFFYFECSGIAYLRGKYFEAKVSLLKLTSLILNSIILILQYLQHDHNLALRYAGLVSLPLMWMIFFFYMRCFDEISWFIFCLANIIQKTMPFFVLLMIFYGLFTTMMMTLNQTREELLDQNYIIHPTTHFRFVDAFLMIFQVQFGEYATDGFGEADNHVAWAVLYIWQFIVIIYLFNTLTGMMGVAFEEAQVMQLQLGAREKAQLIRENLWFLQSRSDNKDIFPDYVYFLSIEEYTEEDSDTIMKLAQISDQVDQVKKENATAIEEMKSNYIKGMQSQISEINSDNQKLLEDIAQIRTFVEKLEVKKTNQ